MTEHIAYSIAAWKQQMYEQDHPEKMMYHLDGSLTPHGRAKVQRWRDAEPPTSNRRLARMYDAALREEYAMQRAELEAIDARLYEWAVG